MSRVIGTERLTLRPWQEDEVPAAMRIFGDPDVLRWSTPALLAPRTPVAARERLRTWAAEARADRDCAGHWAVAEQESGTVVGAVSLNHSPHGGGSIVLGWALERSARGRGYAAEAGDALARWAMHERGVIEVFAILQPGNASAARTAERIGMEQVSEVGVLPRGRYHLFRLRHGDLAFEE